MQLPSLLCVVLLWLQHVSKTTVEQRVLHLLEMSRLRPHRRLLSFPKPSSS